MKYSHIYILLLFGVNTNIFCKKNAYTQIASCYYASTQNCHNFQKIELKFNIFDDELSKNLFSGWNIALDAQVSPAAGRFYPHPGFLWLNNSILRKMPSFQRLILN